MEDFIAKNIRFPTLVTPKIDGIRCLTLDDTRPVKWTCMPITRSGKAIPNQHVRESIAKGCPPWLDGELTSGDNFQAVTRGIMTHGGVPPFTYHVFDARIDRGCTTWGTPAECDYIVCRNPLHYLARIEVLKSLELPEFCKKLLPTEVQCVDHLFETERAYLAQGAEGIMCRPPSSPYKQGRVGGKDPWLIAIKRFEDSEAVIIGFEERMHNTNAAVTTKLGYKERSTHIDGMIPMGMLGAFVVRDLTTNEEFRVGTGFDSDFAYRVWADRYSYLQRVIKYRYQAHGVKDRPRIPSFLGIRDAGDMSPGSSRQLELT